MQDNPYEETLTWQAPSMFNQPVQNEPVPGTFMPYPYYTQQSQLPEPGNNRNQSSSPRMPKEKALLLSKKIKNWVLISSVIAFSGLSSLVAINTHSGTANASTQSSNQNVTSDQNSSSNQADDPSSSSNSDNNGIFKHHRGDFGFGQGGQNGQNSSDQQPNSGSRTS